MARKQKKRTTRPRKSAPPAARQYSSPPCLLPEIEAGTDEAGVRIKRVYDKPERDDGFRVLVDRLWPRGLSKKEAAIDLWARELAPSTELRKWFGHDPKLWETFQKRYRAELRKRPAELRALREKVDRGPVTLVYGARDRLINQAVVLREVLREAGRK